MHIRRAQMSDVSDIATLVADAMDDDQILGLRGFMSPYGYLHPEARRHNFLRRMKRRFYLGMDHFVAVTDSSDVDWDGQEKIAGYMVMSDSQPDHQPSLMMQLNQTLHRFEDIYRWYWHRDPSTTHDRLLAYVKTAAEVDHAEIAGLADQRHHYCEFLAVGPAYQRRGIAQTLLRHAQDEAAAKKFPILLVASPKGERLYLKVGFREVGRAPFAEGSGIIDPVMRWDPFPVAAP